MHTFDYKETPKQLLTADIVNTLSSLHEFKGRQELYIEAESDVLTALLDIAKIQSTKASNKIEGIYTSDERLEALVMDKVEPRNRSEEEIAGYVLLLCKWSSPGTVNKIPEKLSIHCR